MLSNFEGSFLKLLRWQNWGDAGVMKVGMVSALVSLEQGCKASVFGMREVQPQFEVPDETISNFDEFSRCVDLIVRIVRRHQILGHKRLRIAFLTLLLPVVGGQALSAPLMQYPDWQFCVDKRKSWALLQSAPPKQSFEKLVARGRAQETKQGLAGEDSTNVAGAMKKQLVPLPLPKGFREKLKPGDKPATVGKTPAAGGTAVISLQSRYVAVKGDTPGKIAAKNSGGRKTLERNRAGKWAVGLIPISPGQIHQLPCATGGKVIAPIAIQGTFQDALQELIGGVECSGRLLPISIYANKVVRTGRPNLMRKFPTLLTLYRTIGLSAGCDAIRDADLLSNDAIKQTAGERARLSAVQKAELKWRDAK